jgi:hypothetical protein
VRLGSGFDFEVVVFVLHGSLEQRRTEPRFA